MLNEPSVVALNTNTGEIVAVGAEAKWMIGRTPGHIVAVRPLKDGVIADFDVTERMLRYFIQKAHRRRHLAKPRLVVAVPSGITGVVQSAVKEAGQQAGARRVYIIELAGDVIDAASRLPAGVRCCAAWTSGCGRRPECRSIWPTTPLESVALGTGKCVEDSGALQQVLVPDRRR